MTIFNILFGDTLMTNTHKTRIHSLLAIALLAAIAFGQQTAMAQSAKDAPVDSSGSVLHGRTKHVALLIMRVAHNENRYRLYTDLAQLSGVTNLNFGNLPPFYYAAHDGVSISTLRKKV